MNLNGIDASAFTRQLEEQALGPDDTFAFSCDRCGRCCREREDVLLNPADLFRIAKFLNQTPSQVVEHYCECYIGPDSRLPLIRLRPKAYRNTFWGPKVAGFIKQNPQYVHCIRWGVLILPPRINWSIFVSR